MRTLSPLFALLTLIGALAFAGTPLSAQNFIGDFECYTQSSGVGIPGIDCDNWNDESTAILGLASTGNAASGCIGMPTEGLQFLSIAAFPAFSGPSTPVVTSGSNQAAWPFTSGNVSVLTKTTVATSSTLSFDWIFLRDFFAPNYFLQVLVVDPATDQVIVPVLLTESVPLTYTSNLCAPPNGGFPGGPPLLSTTVQFAAATIPPAWVGQNVKITIALGQTDGGSTPGSGQFLETAALIDNMKFAPQPPSSNELVLGPTQLTFSNPAGPGPVSASGTVIGFIDGQGNLVTDPAQDAVVGASFNLTGNLLSAGPDLAGGTLTVTGVNLVAAPGADELSLTAQYVQDGTRDRFRLAGTPAVLPSVERPYSSLLIASPTRTGSGSSILDGFELALGAQSKELTLLFDVVPGQGPRLSRLIIDYHPAPRSPEFNFDTGGAGSLVLGVAGAAPTDELFNVFVVNPTVPLGQGSFFGLEFTPLVSDILMAPLGTVPFHVSPNGEGAFFWGIPAGSLPIGLVLDGAAGTVDPATGFATWISPVVRRSF